MITIFLLSCVIIMVSAVPVGPNANPLQPSQGGATQRSQPGEVTNQNPEAQTPAPLSPNPQQPHPGSPQQLDPQAGAQPSLPQYTWFPQGGSPLIIPLQQSVHGPLPVNQLTIAQQPLMFPPYGFLPLLSSPYSNQLFSPYGFPMRVGSSVPQSPAQQLPSSPVLPAENTAGLAAPSGAAPQQTQQQTPQVLYMLQQPMNPSLGGLSSEELETAAKMSRLGMYMPTLLTNLPAGGGAVQPQTQAAGMTNPAQQGAMKTVGSSAVGVQPLQKVACSEPKPSIPAGLEKAAPEASTVQTPAQPKLQPTQGNLV
ncbi:ameloblastin [Leuresthes tenuis]|uniref:ameloblastin n=1 Tax=Leuresthes tenuis TaxID=355514 RepID=UPI003B507DB7